MQRYVTLEKKIGETPLGALTAWKVAHPEYADTPASYAGRLDPMASGTLLILLGDECKKQDQYTRLDKEYEIEVVLDLESDTGDVLGLPSYGGRITKPEKGEAARALRLVRGTHTVPYPAFSSKTVNGKPLFLHMLEGTLGTIEIPKHEETLYGLSLLACTEISKELLKTRLVDLLALAPRSHEPSKRLGADFRQDEIRAAWDAVFDALPARSFTVIHLRVSCASGTYMRTLASRIAKELDTTGLALSIHRSKIGRLGPWGFWYRRFETGS